MRKTSYVVRYFERKSRLLLLKSAIWVPAIILVIFALGRHSSEAWNAVEISRLLLVTVAGAAVSGGIFGLPFYLDDRHVLSSLSVVVNGDHITITDNATGKTATFSFGDIKEAILNDRRFSTYDSIEIDTRHHGPVYISNSMKNFDAFKNDLRAKCPFKERVAFWAIGRH